MGFNKLVLIVFHPNLIYALKMRVFFGGSEKVWVIFCFLNVLLEALLASSVSS
jgi:hypothetical protein